MKLAAVLIIALEAVASAQPQPDIDPASPPADEPAAVPAEPTTPLTTPSPGHDMAMRMTAAARDAAARGKCALIDALGKRVHELDAAYYDQVFAADATIARCRPGMSAPGMVLAVPSAPSARRLGVTVDGGVGGGMWTDGSDALYGLGGPAFGVGGFITPTVALSLRMSGSMHVGDGGFIYIGVLGPNAQLWLSDNVWLGGGIGLGFGVGCIEGCDGISGVGLDGRLGYAFAPRGQSGMNVSIETTYESFSGMDTGFETVSFMVGYQSF